MYEAKTKRVNWVKMFLIVIIVILILLLTYKCISLIKNNGKNSEEYYKKQLESVNNVALDYYNKDNIPKEVGKSSKKTLAELKDEKVDFELTPRKNESCDLNGSYIQATRLETEYQVKTYIKCDSYDDYINTYIDLKNTSKKEEKEVVPTTETKKTEVITTTTATKKIETTKKAEPTTKASTTKRVYNTTQATVKVATNNEVSIRFNTNGGVINVNQLTIKKGSTTSLPTPVREGYKFDGWYNNGKLVTSKTPIKDSVVLVAMWTRN